MKTKFFFALVCAACLVLTSCEKSSSGPSALEDPTRFNGTSIVGIWACIAKGDATYDETTGQTIYYWDYDPDAETYDDVHWYFNITSDSQVQYMNVTSKDDMGETHKGEYRKSDGYLHIPADSKWRNLVDANYIFDEEHQAIRCTSGKIMGFSLESVADLLGNDTVFFVKRYGIDEAAIIDNTGWIYSQYVVRVKGIKEDL